MNAEDFAVECQTHVDQVWRQLRVMGVAERYLEDATQEVLLIASQKHSSFEWRAKLGTWLYAIAYRVGSNYRRKARRDPAIELVEAQHPDSGQDPEQALAERQAALLVQKFCDQLSEKLLDVFVLCLLEQRTPAEVSVLLGVPENTIYSRIRLAREAFRKELARMEKPNP